MYTLELTELGFSMLAWPQGPPSVFGALLESCFEDVGTSARESERLALSRPDGSTMPSKRKHNADACEVSKG